MSRSRLLLASAVVAGMASLVVASRRDERFREVSDGAVLEISTVEALHARQLTGPYSRFGWNHPGPLYFYVEGPWYLASGRHTAGMQAGALALNLIAVGIVAALCLWWLRPVPASALALALTAYLMRVPDLLVSVWNPHVIVLPMAAVVLLLASFADTGRLSLLLGAVAGGTFLIQTHIAMAPLVAALGVAAIAMQPRAVRAHAPPAIAVAVALWLPPLIEEVIDSPGNLTKLFTFFTRDAPAGQPAGIAMSAWTAALTQAWGRRPMLAMGADLHPAFSGVGLAFAVMELLLLTLLTLRAWRHDRRSTACVLAFLFAASMIALLSVSRISGQLVDHEVFWISMLGALNLGAIAGAGADVAFGPAGTSESALRVSRALITLMVAASVALGAIGMRGVLNRPRTLEDHAVDAIVVDVRQQLSARGARRPLVRIDGSIAPAALGALLQLYKAHQPFAVERSWVHVLGPSFRENGREDLVLTIGGSLAAPRVSVER